MSAGTDFLEDVRRLAPPLVSDSEESADGIEDQPDDEPLAPLDPAIPEVGFIAEYLAVQSAATMAPREFHLASALWIVGALLGPRFRIELGGHQFPATLWTVLMARSGNLKSSALKRATRLLNEATDGRLELDDPVSKEAFVDALRDQPAGFWVWSEFGEFMTQAKREYLAGAKQALCKVFDGDDLRTRSRGEGRMIVQNCSPSIIGATVLDSIPEWVRDVDLTHGFLSRVLFVPSISETAYSTGLRLNEAETKGRTRLLNWLRQADAKTPPGWSHVPISAELEEVFGAYDSAMRAMEVDENLIGLRNRLGIYSLKLAMIYALAERRETPTAEDFRRAVAFVEFCRTRMWPIIEDAGGNSYKAIQMRRLLGIVQRLAANDGGAVPHSKALKAYKADSRSFLEFMSTLEERGDVKVIEREDATVQGAHRKAKFYVPKGAARGHDVGP
jgi:hypothetical protein